MSRTFVIAGTDTNAGKTVFAAALCGAIGARYWKPIQCGLEGGGDVEVVRTLGGVSEDHIVPEAYRFKTPASPHRAAEIAGVEIDLRRLSIDGKPAISHAELFDSDLRPGGPDTRPSCLVIEGAGGLMVPLTRKALQIEIYESWKLPVILCARTALGTINHSLLSVEALQHRDIPIEGIAFTGDANDDSERTICELAGVRRLGRLPRVSPLDRETLAAAFAANFRVEDFA